MLQGLQPASFRLIDWLLMTKCTEQAYCISHNPVAVMDNDPIKRIRCSVVYLLGVYISRSSTSELIDDAIRRDAAKLHLVNRLNHWRLGKHSILAFA